MSAKQSPELQRKPEFDGLQLKKAAVSAKEEPSAPKIQDMEKVEDSKFWEKKKHFFVN